MKNYIVKRITAKEFEFYYNSSVNYYLLDDMRYFSPYTDFDDSFSFSVVKDGDKIVGFAKYYESDGLFERICYSIHPHYTGLGLSNMLAREDLKVFDDWLKNNEKGVMKFSNSQEFSANAIFTVKEKTLTGYKYLCEKYPRLEESYKEDTGLEVKNIEKQIKVIGMVRGLFDGVKMFCPKCLEGFVYELGVKRSVASKYEDAELVVEPVLTKDGVFVNQKPSSLLKPGIKISGFGRERVLIFNDSVFNGGDGIFDGYLYGEGEVCFEDVNPITSEVASGFDMFIRDIEKYLLDSLDKSIVKR